MELSPILVAREHWCANAGLQHIPQQRRKRHERRQVGMGIGPYTHTGARRSVKHPGRNLKPPVRIGTA
jgi:hypothetical protein